MNRKCRICNENLSRNGFNLGGQPTCPACRVFFHRNAKRFENLDCQNSNSCKVNSRKNRNHCVKCRLRRCFEIGMQCRTKKIEAIEANKSESSSSTSLAESPASNCEILRTILGECDSVHKTSDTNETIYAKEEKRTKKLLVLTSFEQSQIDLINQFAADSFEEESTLELESIDPIESTYFVTQTSTVYARRIVRFCKRFDFFQDLNQNVQLKLLKSFSRRVIILRVAFQYDLEARVSKMLANEAGTQAVLVSQPPKHNPNSRGVMKFHKQMSRVNHKLASDPTTRNLLSACLLTRPLEEEEAYEFPPLLRFKFYKFSYLLLRYLESKHHSRARGRQIYQDLIKQFINCFERRMHEKMRQHLSQYSAEHKLSEFAVEIMNLQNSD